MDKSVSVVYNSRKSLILYIFVCIDTRIFKRKFKKNKRGKTYFIYKYVYRQMEVNDYNFNITIIILKENWILINCVLAACLLHIYIYLFVSSEHIYINNGSFNKRANLYIISDLIVKYTLMDRKFSIYKSVECWNTSFTIGAFMQKMFVL